MPVDVATARQRLKDFDLKNLFIEELGWERHAATHDITVDGRSYRLSAVAHKRGFAVFICNQVADGRIPNYATRHKIDRQVTKLAHEHLIVFVDADKTTQIWQWLKKETGKPVACREHTFHRDQPGDALIQKLQALGVSLDEEAGLTLPAVAGRVRAAFDVERVTKRFYDRFKSEHTAFLKFLKGIPDDDMQRWYVSVMLNRLMFIYFIQKKSFLDSNPSYLRDKLVESKKRGKDHFYRDFLCPLFFEGFAKKESERSAATNKLLGRVPYLNGGLFLRHQIEERYGNEIQIADAAFEKLFLFFEQYTWHLDERPLKKDDEINPDVLGYIFEKYVNQKQMGAYYSKEDITGYISQNTVIPFLFDQARKECEIAFEGPHSVWRLLQADPDRYIFDAVKKGAHLELPPEIAAGLNDVSKRTEWNKSAPGDYALPTEIWREVGARRQRYEEVRRKLAAGDIRSIDDLITHNLDIRQFAQDVIESCEGPELLRAFYKAIKNVSVLDPACGSGAFLFAALNILESLYEACLDRMEVFLAELERSGQKHRPEKFADFKKELDRVAAHPNRKYFIYKTIIVNNVFGVDIMEEATEICKLRLFLKLVAQIEQLDQIEPLPDIDFNIRAGNSLVGYASYEDVKRAVTSKLDFEKTMDRIEEKAQEIDRLFALFREMQSDQRMESKEFTDAKNELIGRLKVLEDELNGYLAGEYGVKRPDRSAFEKWLHAHKPLHWFIDFYGMLKGGGFDAIIGNPPYVELAKITSKYQPRGFATAPCGNLYALFAERSFHLLRTRGRFGFIVQQPVTSTVRMAECRRTLLENSEVLWSATFDDRPSKLFDGMHHARLAILLASVSHRHEGQPSLFVTAYNKWSKEERALLFHRLRFVSVDPTLLGRIFPKVGTQLEVGLVTKIVAVPNLMGTWLSQSSTPHHLFYKITGVGNWFTITHRPPRFVRGGRASSSTREATISFPSAQLRDCAFCVLNTSLFYWFYQVRTNCRDFNPSDYRTFPVPESIVKENLAAAANCLRGRLDESSAMISASYKKTGEVKYEQFRPRFAKAVIGQIDRVLAKHYTFTDDEVDFLANYDIKYRMGDELEEAED